MVSGSPCSQDFGNFIKEVRGMFILFKFEKQAQLLVPSS